MRAARPLCLMALLAYAMPAFAAAQQPRRANASFQLTVDNIMRGPELVGSAPRGVQWTDNGERVYFRWKPGGLEWHEEPSLYRVARDGSGLEQLTDEEADSAGVLLADGDPGPDEARRVVAYEGDLWLIQRESLDTRRLTATDVRESSPVFGADGRTVYFVRADNLFMLSLDAPGIRQLTDIRIGSEPEEPEYEGQEEFLREQQRELFEHIRRALAEKEAREARREAEEAEGPETVWIDKGERVWDIAVDPAGRLALVTVGSPAEDDRATLVPDYVTPSGYTRTLEARGKVGDQQGSMRLGLVTLASGDLEWLELVPAEGDAAPENERYRDENRLASVRFLGWSTDAAASAERALGLVSAVGYAYKDQWLYTVDAGSGELALLAHDHDDAWIGGPCPTWTRRSCAGWMPDSESAWFISERDGFSHLYTVDAANGDIEQLTDGEWAVYSAELSPDPDSDPDGSSFYLTTTEVSPFELHVYRMDADGGERLRITGRVGRHEVTVSPDGERLAVVYSYSNRPPELYLMPARPGAEMERITTSPTDGWLSYDWIAPEIVWFEARDGVEVPARIYRPEAVGAGPATEGDVPGHGAAVIFVHGAGYLHNVHNWWSSYYREYMFHHILAERGYTVLDIDYRGSAGYGRDWRTAIYRHMGGKDLTDQVDGARWLVEHEGIDPDRIGIYGGSYGGFITLMALFKHPDVFAAGAALRAVTDWAHYNHWYTGRILNLPQNDSLAYRRSSPIYFAEGLADPLLIAHGMLDTNVHFQGVVRLAQRLIELGKEDWEMAVYPVEGHGFDEPASWADEYRRILELFEENLGHSATTSAALEEE